MRHSARLFIAAMAVATAGCGGAVPGLGPMGNSLTDGLSGNARTQSSKGRQIVQRSPWNVSTLRNRAPRPKFSAERTEKVGDKGVVVRDVTFDAEPGSGSPLSLYGALATPQRPASDRRRLPALVLLADRQSEASEELAKAWAARGYAALALDLPGKGEGREKVRSSGPDWTDEALASASPTANPLHASVAAVINAVSLMAAQPEVDARRVGLVGDGWGGVVACLAGAVDDRPVALVLERTAGGLERGPLAEALKKLSPKDREAWTKAYDPDTYAKADHPPTLFVQPLSASEPSLAAVSATFRARSGTKALALIPPDAKEAETATVTTWLATRLLGETPLPEIRSVRAEGEDAVVRTGGKQPPRSVAVYYAAGDPAKAEWKSAAGEKAGDGIWRCALPKPEEGQPLTVFAALTDARGAILCSEPGPLTTGEPAAKGNAVAARPARTSRPAR
jgi:alpha-beta hydrolase superfamily lysophospholipase